MQRSSQLLLPFLCAILFLAACSGESVEETALDRPIAVEQAPTPAQSEWLNAVVDSIDTNKVMNGVILIQQADAAPLYVSRGSTTLDTSGVPLSLDDRFHVASLSKSFTGLATLMLLEEHSMDADDAIGPYFPELHEALGKVTIRQLANHTNAIHDYFSLTTKHAGIQNKDVLELLSQLDSTVWTPGSSWGYSNSGYVLLAELIERVSGETFKQYISKRIFSKVLVGTDQLRPGKDSYVTGYIDGVSNDEFTNTTGDAGIVMSANDWLAMYHNDTLFSTYWQQAEELSSPWTDPTWRYGFGWYFYQDALGEFRAHSGRTEGFRCYVRVNKDQDLFVLILSNQSHDIVTELRNGIFRALEQQLE